MPYGYVPRKGKSSTDIVRFLPHERFRMRDEFVRPYMTQEPAWGPVGKVVYVRTYARELRGQELVEHLVRDYGRDRIEARAEARKIKVRREEFWQTARRVTEFVWTVFKRAAITNHHAWDEHEAQQKSEEMFRLLWAFKWLPPGRGMQFAGTPVVEKKGAAVLNNPLHENTRVLTQEHGWVRLGDIEGQRVHVLTSTHDYGAHAEKTSGGSNSQAVWAEAQVSHIEQHPCLRLTMEDRHGNQTEIVSSQNHRWFRRRMKSDWVRVTTEELREGDYLPIVKPTDRYKISPYAFLHGMFFGDGTRSNGELHLFGPKSEAASALLPDSAFDNGARTDERVLRQCPLAWGELPHGSYRSDRRYLMGFLAGYTAADGSVDTAGNVTISSAREDELRATAGLFRELGIRCTDPYVAIPAGAKNNFVENRSELYEIRLTAIDLRPDFFLRDDHRARWAANIGTTHRDWAKVVKVERLSGTHPVLCAEVPGYEQFVTEGFVLTSNCGFVSTASIDADFADPFCAIMDFLMLGVGVGSDVKGAGKVVVQQPAIDNSTFVVDDSREGWVEAFRARLLPYVGVQVMPTNWDFSLIRAEGKPLKTFGGTASGHGPLVRLLNAVDEILEPLAGQPITETAIADLVNNIGVCVVAGNIRRSAEILLGEYGDEEFAALKDPTETRRLKARMDELVAETPEAATLQRKIDRWKAGQKGFSAATETFITLQNKMDRAKAKIEKIMRQNAEWAQCETAYWGHPLFTHRWASNNTILCKPTHDFTAIGARIATNGEPGVAFMDNIRAYGRMGNVGATLPPRAKWLDAGVEGFNPCAEQPLEDRELCCLGELNPNAHATLEEFLHTIKFAYMYCKAVTLLPTNHPETNRVMTKNRRIGLSLIGAFEMYDRLGLAECIRWFDAGYNEVCKWDKTYSEWLGCNQSIKKTSLKPGGSVPLLVGKEGGMKVPSAKYYFRTIRAEHRSPLVKEARDKGYRVEKDRYSPRTSVMYFPVHDPNARRTANDVSMWEQLELLAAIQGYWSDNMVSNTVTFKAHEAKDIPRAITVFAHRVKAISFLPLDDHGYPQAPYIPISKEEYEYAAARCRPLDLAAVAHEVDEKYCTGDACEIRPR